MLHYIKYSHQDPNKPNFVFSSDIPEKIEAVVKRYVEGHSEEISGISGRQFDLGSNIEVHLNIELNTLLVRNKDLRPSDLIKENLVCLAQSSAPKNTRNIKHYPQIIQPLVSNEILIVTIKLKLLEFTYNESDDRIAIDFLKDENYGLVVLCDEQMIDQIENYIRKNFIKELKRQIGETREKKDIEIEEKEREENQTDQMALENTTIVSNIVRTISISDTTLDGDESEINDTHKEEDSYEDDEFELSLDELLLLRSNDTTRSNSNDEEFYIEKPKIEKAEKMVGFIKNMDNLRHNEDEFIKLDDLLELECGLDDNPPEQTETHKDITNTSSTLDLQPPVKLSPKLSPTSSSSFVSPTKRKSLSRVSSSSFSMVNYEDTYDLEYAFKNKSPLVPTYIKQDKKFKFIKVGKVQKFVNLFEEKTEELSRPASRPTSRPTSPIRK